MTDTMTIEQLADRVNGSAYAMDMDVARMFAGITGRPETEVLGVLRAGIQQRQREYKGRNKYEDATRNACNMLVSWYRQADTYAVSDLVGFVASHDALCVYAVLVGQQAQVSTYKSRTSLGNV